MANRVAQHIPIRVQPALQPNPITLNVSTNRRIVIAEVVVVRCLLARQGQLRIRLVEALRGGYDFPLVIEKKHVERLEPMIHQPIHFA